MSTPQNFNYHFSADFQLFDQPLDFHPKLQPIISDFLRDKVETRRPDKLFCPITKPIFFPSQPLFQTVPVLWRHQAQIQKATFLWTPLQPSALRVGGAQWLSDPPLHLPHLVSCGGSFSASLTPLLLALSCKTAAYSNSSWTAKWVFLK